MRHVLIGRALRALRHRRGWRQRDAAARAGIARSVLSDFEAGQVERHALGALLRAADAVGAWVRVDLVVPGGDLRRLLDADHAAIQASWAELLERSGWTVEAEATFNHFGERGSVDLLGWHAASRTLAVVEIKTIIVDVQDLLASLDRKRRVATSLASERGWSPLAVVPVLLVAEGTTARRRLADHAPLFRRFTLRGRTAVTWLRHPTGDAPAGVLCLTKLPLAHPRDRRRAGRQRVRRSRADPRSEADA